MWKMTTIAGVLAASLAVPASAACHEPRAPIAVDGATASDARMHRLLRRVKTFLKQSDDYQLCVLQKLHGLQGYARHAHIVLDSSIHDATEAMIRDNQTLKEKVGADFNKAAIAFRNRCAANPRGRGCPVRPPSAVEQ